MDLQQQQQNCIQGHSELEMVGIRIRDEIRSYCGLLCSTGCSSGTASEGDESCSGSVGEMTLSVPSAGTCIKYQAFCHAVA